MMSMNKQVYESHIPFDLQ